MKKLFITALFFCATVLLYAQAGMKLRMTTLVEGENREYFLHIPSSYDGKTDVPLVFMLHGTGGDGEKMYDISGWAELAEKENFIAAFPSSMRYKIIDTDSLKITTKWNTTPDAEWTFQPGEVGKDDIKFLKKVIQEMIGNYRIDTKRIYLNGFSNGGAMAAKCTIEMSDIVAAVCENAGSFHLDTVYVPNRILPTLYQVGNKDYGPGNDGPEAPMLYFDSLISTPRLNHRNGKLQLIAQNHIRNFQLRENHSIVGDSNLALVATYLPQDSTANHEFKYIFVKGLGHSYPNWAPAEHWKWLKKYTLDQSGNSQFTLITENGYGGGNYDEGDQVHIWSEQRDDQVFTQWTGDVQYLESPNEYHSKVSIPNKNIRVTAQFAKLSPNMVMKSFNVQAAERNKLVYFYIPPDLKSTKGLVWFFHGTNGSAENFTSDPETKQMINLLMVNQYAIVALTSEESEFNIDMNNDGYYRWSYGIDSTLIDIANVRAIRDSLINRKLIDSKLAQYAVGWSAGGAFTEFISNTLGWNTAINHTSSGSTALSLNSQVQVPFLISINENDNNPNVGAQGNLEAKQNIENYKNRGACAQLHEQLKAPLYPERFDRSNMIDIGLSREIFREIQKNNLLDENNYFKGLFSQLLAAVQNNPGAFPVIIALSAEQKEAVQSQIEVTNAEHKFKADINYRTLQFMEHFCSPNTSIQEENLEGLMKIYPNPSYSEVKIEGNFSEWSLHDLRGRIMLKGNDAIVELEGISVGIYILKVDKKIFKLVKL